MRADVVALLDGVAQGDAATMRASLRAGQRPFAFSPFTRCLPPQLVVEALLERSFDVEGLIRLVRRGDADRR